MVQLIAMCWIQCGYGQDDVELLSDRIRGLKIDPARLSLEWRRSREL